MTSESKETTPKGDWKVIAVPLLETKLPTQAAALAVLAEWFSEHGNMTVDACLELAAEHKTHPGYVSWMLHELTRVRHKDRKQFVDVRTEDGKVHRADLAKLGQHVVYDRMILSDQEVATSAQLYVYMTEASAYGEGKDDTLELYAVSTTPKPLDADTLARFDSETKEVPDETGPSGGEVDEVALVIDKVRASIKASCAMYPGKFKTWTLTFVREETKKSFTCDS
jgi:hypothetical protein